MNPMCEITLDDISFTFASDARDEKTVREPATPPSDSSRREQGVRVRNSAASTDPLVGTTIADRYEVLRPIGRGGMGVVYAVEHVRLGKLLAMKVLSGDLAEDPRIVRRFAREAFAVSKLQSSNTVQVFDFGVEHGMSYLVMELVPGRTLSATLRSEGPLDPLRVAKIALQICSSLAEAHKKGVVHRDVKPDNVMLLSGPDGVELAKVLDFGLAKLRESSSVSVTSRGMVLGTPYYMAPEQIRGEEVDARTDVYALGALMYRVLTGLYPFDGTPTEVMSKHLTEPLVPPDERAPQRHIGALLSATVCKAMARDPSARHASVDELSTELAMVIDAIPSAPAPAPAARSGRQGIDVIFVDESTLVHATREDVSAFERRLRQPRAAWAVLVLSTLAVLGALVFGLTTIAPPVVGAEREPNDDAAHASALLLGTPVTGQIGKRVDASHGDRDVYFVDLPASSTNEPARVDVHLAGLSNLALCVQVYERGASVPNAHQCADHAGGNLALRGLLLEPGRSFLAVFQDTDRRGGEPVRIEENASESYRLTIDLAPRD